MRISLNQIIIVAAFTFTGSSVFADPEDNLAEETSLERVQSTELAAPLNLIDPDASGTLTIDGTGLSLNSTPDSDMADSIEMRSNADPDPTTETIDGTGRMRSIAPSIDTIDGTGRLRSETPNDPADSGQPLILDSVEGE